MKDKEKPQAEKKAETVATKAPVASTSKISGKAPKSAEKPEDDEKKSSSSSGSSSSSSSPVKADKVQEPLPTIEENKEDKEMKDMAVKDDESILDQIEKIQSEHVTSPIKNDIPTIDEKMEDVKDNSSSSSSSSS